MINLSYRYDQNSSSLQIDGMPDVSSDDSDKTIGILSSWKLRIIGCPLLEGKKEHLDKLMNVILRYSRSYISGIRKTFTSSEDLVSISPFGEKHKLRLNSTQKDVKPLEIIIDDSELSDLTRCIDLLRFDHRVKIKWNFELDKPYRKRYISNNIKKSNNYLTFVYASLIFLFSTSLLILIPINKNNEYIESNTETSFVEQ